MITFAEYLDILDDHPLKFEDADVGFTRGGGEGPIRCGKCFHFFTNPVSPTKVCEIMRPDDGKSVMPNDVCQFMTVDGKNYPLLSDEKQAGIEREDSEGEAAAEGEDESEVEDEEADVTD